MPPQIPDKTWVPAWTLRDSKSFSEVVLDKIKGPAEKPTVKHRKIDEKTKVITDDEVYAQEVQQISKTETENIYVHKATEKKH